MNNLENITKELACKDFDLPETTAFENLRQLLLERMVYLLIHDLPGLWNILYRIDVNERKVKQLFDANTPEHIAPGLTDLVLQRLKEKAETRLKYKNK